MRESIKISTNDTLLSNMLIDIPGPTASNTPTAAELSLRDTWLQQTCDGDFTPISMLLDDVPQDLLMIMFGLTMSELGHRCPLCTPMG